MDQEPELPAAAAEPAFDRVAESKRLLRSVRAGSLATLTGAGEPFASLTTVATEHDGSPLLLISRLSAHTRHLENDGRCSLLLADTGPGDPLAHPRLTITGTATKVTDTERRRLTRARFLAKHPRAELYADFGDFSFWSIAMDQIHLNGGFARAYALAAFKSDTTDEMRAASATLHGLLHVELPMHLRFCAGWGLDAECMAAEPEALETIAYTRFVLDRGVAGDRLDLEAALAPCVLGYAAVGRPLAPAADVHAHPYREWIALYAGDEYQAVARDSASTLDRCWTSRGGPNRYPALVDTFRQACRLEAAFWSMGYAAGAAAL